MWNLIPPKLMPPTSVAVLLRCPQKEQNGKGTFSRA